MLPTNKLACICTDGAASMRGRENGLLALLKKDESFSSFITFHCIIHQHALLGKVLKLDHVMKVVVEIVNFIRARALNHRQFRQLLEDVDAEYDDLVLHTDVRWLSRGKVLERFSSLLPAIKTFLATKGKPYEQLEDALYLMDLGFLTDITAHLNELNLKLQGSDKLVTDMFSAVSSFARKLDVYQTDLSSRRMQYFPALKAQCQSNNIITDDEINTVVTKYYELLTNLATAFQERFSEFQELQPLLNFVVNPFISDPGHVSRIANQLQLLGQPVEMEIIDLQENIVLQQSIKPGIAFTQFWKLVPKDNFPLCHMLVSKIVAFFGSTYLCEKGFSLMKNLKSSSRSRLSNQHLQAQMRACLSPFSPELDKLSANMQIQKSH